MGRQSILLFISFSLCFHQLTLLVKGFSINNNQSHIRNKIQANRSSNEIMAEATTNGNGGKTILNRVTPNEVGLEIKDPVDPQALEQAKTILAELLGSDDNDGKKSNGVNEKKLIEVAQRLGDISNDSTKYTITKEECENAYNNLKDSDRNALKNMYERIKTFATLQRNSIQDMECDIPGGKAGHTVSPCNGAGCYAPGGRYPLPSSVLMTAVTARAAGCQYVVLASPKPAQITMAAAHLAQVDQFLCIGGAQAIAAMAYGVIGTDDNNNNIPRCDVICGPGNKWVTAAKSIINGYCGIDMLAGPSEVLVICDENANAEIVAADLIAQAEHDVVARAILLCTDENIINEIDKQVVNQVQCLPEPNKSTAMEALKHSFAVLCDTIEQCIQISDDIAPEHLEIQTKDAMSIGEKCNNYGGLFIGENAAEVLGDYGAGPNHTLPTGGTGRYTGGLSVFNFLRIRTWMRIDNIQQSQSMVNDSIIMARLEGLEGHARAAETRSLEHTPQYKRQKEENELIN